MKVPLKLAGKECIFNNIHEAESASRERLTAVIELLKNNHIEKRALIKEKKELEKFLATETHDAAKVSETPANDNA